MIFDAIIGAFMGVVRAMLNLIPSWEPPAAAMSDQAHTVGAIAAGLSGYFPLTLLGVSIVTLIGARLALIVYRSVTRIWELLPFT